LRRVCPNKMLMRRPCATPSALPRK
jgi:hypothetical protein